MYSVQLFKVLSKGGDNKDHNLLIFQFKSSVHQRTGLTL